MTPAITICFSGHWACDSKLNMFISQEGEVSFSQAGTLRSEYEHNWFSTFAKFNSAVKRYLKSEKAYIKYVKVWGEKVDVSKEGVEALILATLKAGF